MSERQRQPAARAVADDDDAPRRRRAARPMAPQPTQRGERVLERRGRRVLGRLVGVITR